MNEKELTRWINEIPYLSVPDGVEVRAIPPFAGAVIRLTFRLKNTPYNVSCFLDGYDSLGCVGEPYWEIYPNTEEEPTARFALNETDEMINAIVESLKLQQQEDDAG